ncbi:MAG: hypothetical protein Q4C72_03520 [Eubacteriales bacterium]|nr:hypothetical protein [Eubacteriales bacterium]
MKKAGRTLVMAVFSAALLVSMGLGRQPEAAAAVNGRTQQCVYRGETYSFVKPLEGGCAQACAVWRVDPATGEYDTVVPDASSAVFYQNKIYFIDHAARTCSIYCKPIGGGQTELVRGDGRCATDGWPARVKQVFYDEIGVRDGAVFYISRVYETPENPAVTRQAPDGTRRRVRAREQDPFVLEQRWLRPDGQDALIETLAA